MPTCHSYLMTLQEPYLIECASCNVMRFSQCRSINDRDRACNRSRYVQPRRSGAERRCWGNDASSVDLWASGRGGGEPRGALHGFYFREGS